MNKNLKNKALSRGYTGIISLKNFSVNIFQIYATQRLGYCLMEKIREVSYKDWQCFFPKETFLVYPILTSFTQRKRETYDANDLLTLSLFGIIVYIYSLGKKFYGTYLKTTKHEMILSYAKFSNEKMRK